MDELSLTDGRRGWGRGNYKDVTFDSSEKHLMPEY